MKKTARIMVIIGGVILCLMGIFHTLFWEAMDWHIELEKLSQANSNIVQFLNIGMITLLLGFGISLISCHKEIIVLKLGRAILISLSLFFFVRCVSMFFLPDNSMGMAIFLFMISLLFLIPAIISFKHLKD